LIRLIGVRGLADTPKGSQRPLRGFKGYARKYTLTQITQPTK